ncbi:ATP-dependent Clp protease proteolytic subunit [Solimonas marina]|uniref:ATP-dependent Clp protease proteolytic subunit n=1 Tax=Solimonas marina TaxID=2714601 RepID=A0A970B4Z6_9GAMM|nr:ATP-dependent Clp protease proteolytic subunit [Solimonas marina]NKF21035.1 ATP-dependent Clp protease proteolytic subunit [Solimonas marina]
MIDRDFSTAEKETDAKAAAPKTPGLDERLFKARTILIYGAINQKLAETFSARLLALAAESDDPITIYINSQGGHVESGDTIHDMIKFVKPTVRVIGTGWVASAGALIYSAAKPENRLSLPNTRFMLHQPSGGAGGTASDIAIMAKEIVLMRLRLNEIFARETGQPLERIQRDTERDYWMSAQQAKEYGLVGRIINNASEIDG